MAANRPSPLSGLFGSSRRSSDARKTFARIPLTGTVPWTAAHFPSEGARDRFLGAVATGSRAPAWKRVQALSSVGAVGVFSVSTTSPTRTAAGSYWPKREEADMRRIAFLGASGLALLSMLASVPATDAMFQGQ
jgi:hypothetical protein